MDPRHEADADASASQCFGAEAIPPPVRYRGKVDVFVERVRDGKPRELRLDEPGALPLTADDRFRIRGEVDPPAYLYLVWVDPDHDVTPAYPWNPEAERWQGTRPAVEEQTEQGGALPRDVQTRCRSSTRSRAWRRWCCSRKRRPRWTCRTTHCERWFKELPELALPPAAEGAAVWFDNYAVVTTDPSVAGRGPSAAKRRTIRSSAGRNSCRSR